MGRPKGSMNKSTLMKLGLMQPNGLPVPQKEAEDTRTDSDILLTLVERFDVYGELIQGAIDDAITSSVISGSAGIGKSYVAETLLERAKETRGTRYVVIKGKISAIELYAKAFEYSAPGDIILLDDADSIFDDEQGLNLLKALLDTSVDRKVSWWTNHPRFTGEDALPREFIYRGSMMFLTNKNFQHEIDRGIGKNVEHFKAIADRSLYLDLKLHTRREVMVWVNHIVRRNKVLQQIGLSAEQEQIALRWIRENSAKLRELSIRTALKVGRFIKMNSDNWESIAKMTLLRNDGGFVG